MQVTMMGFKSGYKADVYCRPGSRCYVDCLGNGCQQLNLRCYDGSQCVVTPAGCEPDGGKKKGADIHCPIWRELVTGGDAAAPSTLSQSDLTPQEHALDTVAEAEKAKTTKSKSKTKTSKSVLGPLPKHKSALIQHTEDEFEGIAADALGDDVVAEIDGEDVE